MAVRASVGTGAGRGAAFPALAGMPGLGSLLDLKADSLGTYLRAQRRHGDVVRIDAGPPGLRMELYCVFSAEGAQQVLASESANFRKDNPFYEEIRESFGNGLLTAQDADYLRQRRLVQPLFTRKGWTATPVRSPRRRPAPWRPGRGRGTGSSTSRTR